MQPTQAFAPALALYVLTPQSRQLAALLEPVTVEYEPALQRVQTTEVELVENLPTAQVEHTVAPYPELYFPLGQPEQKNAP